MAIYIIWIASAFSLAMTKVFSLAMAKIFSFCNDEGFSLAMKMLKPRNDDCFNVNENPCNSYRSF